MVRMEDLNMITTTMIMVILKRIHTMKMVDIHMIGIGQIRRNRVVMRMQAFLQLQWELLL